MAADLQNVLDTFSELTEEEQSIFIEIVNRRLIEKRRQEIKFNAEETFEAIESGNHKSGDITDLTNDLEK